MTATNYGAVIQSAQVRMTILGRKCQLSFFGSGRSNPKHRLPLGQIVSGRCGRGADVHTIILGVGTWPTVACQLKRPIRPIAAAQPPRKGLGPVHPSISRKFLSSSKTPVLVRIVTVPPCWPKAFRRTPARVPSSFDLNVLMTFSVASCFRTHLFLSLSKRSVYFLFNLSAPAD